MKKSTAPFLYKLVDMYPRAGKLGNKNKTAKKKMTEFQKALMYEGLEARRKKYRKEARINTIKDKLECLFFASFAVFFGWFVLSYLNIICCSEAWPWNIFFCFK